MRLAATCLALLMLTGCAGLDRRVEHVADLVGLSTDDPGQAADTKDTRDTMKRSRAPLPEPVEITPLKADDRTGGSVADGGQGNENPWDEAPVDERDGAGGPIPLVPGMPGFGEPVELSDGAASAPADEPAAAERTASATTREEVRKDPASAAKVVEVAPVQAQQGLIAIPMKVPEDHVSRMPPGLIPIQMKLPSSAVPVRTADALPEVAGLRIGMSFDEMSDALSQRGYYWLGRTGSWEDAVGRQVIVDLKAGSLERVMLRDEGMPEAEARVTMVERCGAAGGVIELLVSNDGPRGETCALRLDPAEGAGAWRISITEAPIGGWTLIERLSVDTRGAAY